MTMRVGIHIGHRIHDQPDIVAVIIGCARRRFHADSCRDSGQEDLGYGAPTQDVGPLYGIGVSVLNKATQPEPVEADGSGHDAIGRRGQADIVPAGNGAIADRIKAGVAGGVVAE